MTVHEKTFITVSWKYQLSSKISMECIFDIIDQNKLMSWNKKVYQNIWIDRRFYNLILYWIFFIYAYPYEKKTYVMLLCSCVGTLYADFTCIATPSLYSVLLCTQGECKACTLGIILSWIASFQGSLITLIFYTMC